MSLLCLIVTLLSAHTGARGGGGQVTSCSKSWNKQTNTKKAPKKSPENRFGPQTTPLESWREPVPVWIQIDLCLVVTLKKTACAWGGWGGISLPPPHTQTRKKTRQRETMLSEMQTRGEGQRPHANSYIIRSHHRPYV